MKNEVLCAARFIPCELLDARPSALDYAIQDITHNLTDSVMCELEKGELICSLQSVEEYQLHDLNTVEIRRKVTLKRLVRCKDCKYKPKWREGASEKHRDGLDLIFPEWEENPLNRQERMEKQRLDFIADLYKYTANLILTYDEHESDEEEQADERM